MSSPWRATLPPPVSASDQDADNQNELITFFADSFARRVQDLAVWHAEALEVYEGRTLEQINLAADAMLLWLRGDFQGTLEESVLSALETVMEATYGWLNGTFSVSEDLCLDASPVWEVSELYLVVGLITAEVANAILKSRSAAYMPAAAALFADAERARDRWISWPDRGLSGCRMPHPKLERADATVKMMKEEEILQRGLSARGRLGREAQRAKDPKSAVMAKIKSVWLASQNAGSKARYRNDADFARAMHSQFSAVIKSDGSIRNAITKWRKESSCKPNVIVQAE